VSYNFYQFYTEAPSSIRLFPHGCSIAVMFFVRLLLLESLLFGQQHLLLSASLLLLPVCDVPGISAVAGVPSNASIPVVASVSTAVGSPFLAFPCSSVPFVAKNPYVASVPAAVACP
jgi:hypothetical protein